MTPGERVAGKIRDGRTNQLQRRAGKPSAASSNRASEMGHPCLRYLYLIRMAGHKALPWSLGLQAIFEDGDLHETAVRQAIENMGFRIAGTQTAFPPNAYQIGGKIDVMIAEYQDDSEGDPQWVKVGAEIKSMNGPDWDALIELESSSLLTHPRERVRKYYTQVQLYIYFSGLTEWLLVAKNKWNGQWKIVVVNIDYPHLQESLDRAAAVNEAIRRACPPDFLRGRPDVCRGCRMLEVCQPPVNYGPGLHVVTDPFLLELDETRRKYAKEGKLYSWASDRERTAVKTMAQPPEGWDGFTPAESIINIGQTLARVKFQNERVSVTFEDLGTEDTSWAGI